MSDFKDKLKKYESKAIDMLASLVGYNTVLEEYNKDSIYPFGIENYKALTYLLEEAKKDGFAVKNVDNYAGHIEFGKGEYKLGILAHLDVVPVKKEEWISDPFKLSIRDNRFYARGTLDDKGPLVASYIALKMLKDEGYNPNGMIRLIAGCDEESGSRCVEHYFTKEAKPLMGFSPDAEFPLIYGEKAMMSYDILVGKDNVITKIECGDRYNIVPSLCKVELNIDLKNEFNKYLSETNHKGEVIGDTYLTYGVASHAMAPQNGVNALDIMMDFLSKYSDSKIAKFFNKYLTFDPFGKKMGYDVYDPELKELTSNVALCNGTDDIKIGVNCRCPLNDHLEVIETKINNAAKAYSYEAKVVAKSNRHYVSKDSVLVKKLMAAYQTVTNDYETEPFTIGGGTYAREIENAVAFGALAVGKEDVCHIANEYFEIENFYMAIEVYYNAIKGLME